MTDESVLLIERDGNAAVLTMNRPAKKNALSSALRKALVSAFYDLAGDTPPPVVILTGAGDAFTAGLDLKELGEKGLGAGGTGEDSPDVNVIRAMHSYPSPIIGAIGGVAVTGGFEVALACDFMIATPNARFADTHARVGIMPGWGLSQRLSRLIGIGRAKELSLTGNYLDAETAERWGLVNRVVGRDELIPTCKAIADDIASCDPAVTRRYKSVIDEGFAMTFGDGMKMEARTSIEHAKTVSADAIEQRRMAVVDRGRTQK